MLGLFAAFGGFLYAATIIYQKLRSDITIQGWSALMVVVLLLGGLNLLMLGVIGEYLWRTLDQTKLRPLFIVEKVAGGRPPGGTAEKSA